MPKITKPTKTTVVFTAEEVWDALRKAHPQLGMPEWKLSDEDEDIDMAVVGNVDDVSSDFTEEAYRITDEDEGIAVQFPATKGKGV